MRYWTADWHIYDEEIIDYCKRPFKSEEHAIKRTLSEANMRAKKDDVLWHVGDQAIKKAGKHIRDILPLIDAKLITVQGNHDANNGVKSNLEFALVNIGKYTAFVTHYPTFNSDNEVFSKRKWDSLRNSAHLFADFAICGHVHDRWTTAVDDYTGMLNINVGIDVHKYRPINDQEVIKIFEETKR